MSEQATESVHVEDTVQYESYWGTDTTERFTFPDNKQYIEFKIMNEGDKTKFQKLTNQDLIVQRDQSARVKTDPAAERHMLIKTSVTGWFMVAPNVSTGKLEPAAYSPQLLEKWLTVAPPKLVEDLEYAIRMANPWMQQDMSIEEIDKEIDRLHEVRKQVVDREAGESASANK